MTDSAELALAALARDLVEELAAGRAVELSQAAQQQAALAAVPVLPARKGAAAVHPRLGRHLVKLPGETVSEMAYSHVPKPLPVQAPDPRDLALADAHAALGLHRQGEAERVKSEQAAEHAQRTGIPAPGSYAPLDDDAYEMHVARARHAIAAELAAGNATDRTQTLDGHGQVWTPQRAAVHNQVVKAIADKAVTVPAEGKAAVVTGAASPAKAAVLSRVADGRHAVVSLEAVKDELARRGLVPQAEGLSPAESSALVHAEAGHVVMLAASALAVRRKNLALDIPGSDAGSLSALLAWLASRGYHGVHGVHVHTPPDAQAAAAAHRRSLEAYRQGRGSGGRLALPDVIRPAEAAPGVAASKAAFDSVRGQFGSWEEYDSDGGRPHRTGSSEPASEPGITSVEDLGRR